MDRQKVKRRSGRLVLGVALLFFASLPLAGSHAADERTERFGGDAARVARGFASAPVPLNVRGLDRELVGLGSYLVNAAGGCNDCHTNPPYLPGGDPHKGQPAKINKAGYLAGGQHFGPGIVSPNLTPDAKGLPGGMTYNKYLAAMRYGKDPNHPKQILQVMPWPVYSHLSDHDLYAIYQYLRAIPSRAGAAKTAAK